LDLGEVHVEPGQEGWSSSSTVHPTVTSKVPPELSDVSLTVPLGTVVGGTVVGGTGVVVTVVGVTDVGVTVDGVTAVVVGGAIAGGVEDGEVPPDPPDGTAVPVPEVPLGGVPVGVSMVPAPPGAPGPIGAFPTGPPAGVVAARDGVGTITMRLPPGAAPPGTAVVLVVETPCSASRVVVGCSSLADREMVATITDAAAVTANALTRRRRLTSRSTEGKRSLVVVSGS
jgi:hypothetical protein